MSEGQKKSKTAIKSYSVADTATWNKYKEICTIQGLSMSNEISIMMAKHVQAYEEGRTSFMIPLKGRI